MPTSVPAAIPSDGYILVKWVTTIATKTSPSLATELNAASSLDITCYLKTHISPETSVESVEDWRACLRNVLETAGTQKTTIAPFEIIYDVQNASSVPNKAYAALTPTTTGFLCVRYGMDVDTALAAAQKIDVFPVYISARDKMAPERNSQLKAKVSVMIRDVPAYDVTIAA